MFIDAFTISGLLLALAVVFVLLFLIKRKQPVGGKD